jgi:hypothetical protein
MDQRVPLGRPNRNEDGEPKLLAEALADSPVETAYTRREPSENHPYARVVAVRHAPSGQLQVIEWTLKGDDSGPKPHFPHPSDVQHAEAYTADTLNIPRAALWWSATGGLSIQYTEDDYSTALAVD